MSNNNQNFESRGVSLTPAQWERCDRLTDEYGKKSRNSFIREAVDFYCAWLEKEHMERFLLPSLESVMDSKIKDSEGRIPYTQAPHTRSSKPSSKGWSFLC